MTLIVQQPISHIGLPPQQLDIAYAAAPPSSDPATPRAVLTHAAIDIVAAAVTLAPALTPALPPDNPEYFLASASPKRKAADDEPPLDAPRISKRAKSDDDAFFGSLADQQSLTQVISSEADPIQASIEQALAAILTYTASSSSSSSSPDVVVVDPHCPIPASPQPPSQPEHEQHVHVHVPPPRIPLSPLATSFAPDAVEVEAPTPALAARPAASIQLPPRNRVVEPPLWKMACRTRVDHIVSMYGGSAIRATILQEHAHAQAQARYSSSHHPVVRRSAPAPVIVQPPTNDLELEIYTPMTFHHHSSDDKDGGSVGVDVDMAFELEDEDEEETDSEDDDDEEFESIDEDGEDVLSVHESILDVSFSSPTNEYPHTHNDDEASSSSPSTPHTHLLQPITIPSLPLLPYSSPSSSSSPHSSSPSHSSPLPHSSSSSSPSPQTMHHQMLIWPPRLPRLSGIPVYCLREYPQMERLGTPAQNPLGARGSLGRRCCRGGSGSGGFVL
ncbi:hypothetical protein BDW22DRAFT_1425738 [Trametopsis cervina]|nr:hypothetical protein BDW22DRAFT_1425738 [Trametopsis cervina]